MIRIGCCRNCEEKRKELSSNGTNCHMICELYLKEKERQEALRKKHCDNLEVDNAIHEIIARRKKAHERFMGKR